LEDNFLWVDCETSSHQEALLLARPAADALVQHLGVLAGQYISARPLVITCENQDDRPVPPRFTLGSVTGYDLGQLKAQIEDAAEQSALGDPQLERAVEYAQHAKWLFEQRVTLQDPEDRNSRLLISSIFLNLWKSASTIVGDPSSDRDYRTRYQTLGFDEGYFENQIERVRRLRNSHDVAHYSLDPMDLDEVERSYGDAVRIVSEIIQARVRQVRSTNESEGRQSPGNGGS
jgi:hypothetical protein